MFQETSIKTEIVSSSSPDLIEAKNSVISAQREIIRLKEEKIERMTEELRAFKATAELLGQEKKTMVFHPPRGSKCKCWCKCWCSPKKERVTLRVTL